MVFPAPQVRYPRDRLALDYVASADLASGVGVAAATWFNLAGTQSFEVRGATSIVEVAARGLYLGGNAAATHEIASRLTIDGVAVAQLGGASVPAAQYGNFLTGAGVVALAGLAVGTHTLGVQGYSTAVATIYCRAATQPSESFAVMVVERRMTP